MSTLQSVVSNFSLPAMLIVGVMIVLAFYLGRTVRHIRLPLIIGYMLLGVLLGPSFLNLVDDAMQSSLGFLTDIALGFVALSIGLELHLASFKRQGRGIGYIILAESLGTFLLVFLFIYLVTGNLPLALVFGAVAPASAPAGTIAVIQEYKAKGRLTKALYAVVGFDDGLAIIIFGFAFAIVRNILQQEAGQAAVSGFIAFLQPLIEILLSCVVGLGIGALFCVLARKLEDATDIFVLTFGFILTVVGICQALGISLILANMIFGMLVVNTQPYSLLSKINERLSQVMLLLFVLFFTLAGTGLHIAALLSLGLLGLVYILTRSAGLIGGARLGATIGRADNTIKKYLGLGILSQAGVAIGLSLIVKRELSGLGKVVDTVSGSTITVGDQIGTTLLTVITASSIFFEIIGPILTKIALSRAGEIKTNIQKTE